MKINKKYLILPWLLTMSFSLVSCGSGEDGATSTTGSTGSAVVNPGAPAGSTGSSTPTTPPTAPPATTPTSTSGCRTPRTTSRDFWNVSFTGHGDAQGGGSPHTLPVTQYISGFRIPDQLLRTQVVVGPAIASSTSTATNYYDRLDMAVTLVINGVAQEDTKQYASARYNTSTTSTPVDFSSYSSRIRSTDNVGFRISEVKSDYKCNNVCSTLVDYTYSCSYWYCGWNADYTRYNQCVSLNCPVGAVTQYAGWSLTLRVETYETPCFSDGI